MRHFWVLAALFLSSSEWAVGKMVILVVHLSNMCFAIFRTVQLCQNCPIMHGRFIITRTNQMLLWVSCVRRRPFFFPPCPWEMDRDAYDDKIKWGWFPTPSKPIQCLIQTQCEWISICLWGTDADGPLRKAWKGTWCLWWHCGCGGCPFVSASSLP